MHAQLDSSKNKEYFNEFSGCATLFSAMLVAISPLPLWSRTMTSIPSLSQKKTGLSMLSLRKIQFGGLPTMIALHR